MAIKRPCRKPGCKRLTADRSGFCEEHKGMDKREYQEGYNKNRLPAHLRGYDYKWHKVRNNVLKKHGGLCAMCKEQGIIKPADVVHHIDEDSKNNRMENLMPLCYKCHTDIHKGICA